MFPDIVIIEEQNRRERQSRWEPVPLHAPSPLPRRPDSPQREERDTEPGGSVIIIDISDYSETRI